MKRPSEISSMRVTSRTITYHHVTSSTITYHLISFGGVLQIIFLVLVQSKPDHHVEFGLNGPTLGAVTTLARKLKENKPNYLCAGINITLPAIQDTIDWNAMDEAEDVTRLSF